MLLPSLLLLLLLPPLLLTLLSETRLLRAISRSSWCDNATEEDPVTREVEGEGGINVYVKGSDVIGGECRGAVGCVY